MGKNQVSLLVPQSAFKCLKLLFLTWFCTPQSQVCPTQQWTKLPGAVTALFCVAVAFRGVKLWLCCWWGTAWGQGPFPTLWAAELTAFHGAGGKQELPCPCVPPQETWFQRCCWEGCQADLPKSRQCKEEFKCLYLLENQRWIWFSPFCSFDVLLKFCCILVRNYREVVQHQQGWSVLSALVSLIGSWTPFFFFFF